MAYEVSDIIITGIIYFNKLQSFITPAGFKRQPIFIVPRIGFAIHVSNDSIFVAAKLWIDGSN